MTTIIEPSYQPPLGHDDETFNFIIQIENLNLAILKMAGQSDYLDVDYHRSSQAYTAANSSNQENKLVCDMFVKKNKI